ncbi:MAG: alkaline shock response membrane anchor protein AmaP [Clostridia bacterium]|nr:alkaline shock response membrane anchor protein AmaP [Clostridia bacterium]
MKLIERIGLVIYSYIVLILATILSLIIVGLLDVSLVQSAIEKIMQDNIISKVVLGINVIFILLSIRCIFFDSKEKKSEKDKQGILLKNESGKLLISKETVENLTNSVIKEFESVEEINTKIIIDKENNLIITVNLVVGQNVIIKELSVNLQSKIKETIKTALDLEVKEVNIKVKNYVSKNENSHVE